MTAARLVLVRHGETAWTISGQHTSRTDIALTERGRAQARGLAGVLAAYSPTTIVTSPMQRAKETATLAGFATPEVSDDLREWDYGDFEGRTTADIRADAPSWSLWHDGAPAGETPAKVAARADSVIGRLRQQGGIVLVFSHGHLLRVLAARWVGMDGSAGASFVLSPASVSVLGWEREQAVFLAWNTLVDVTS